MKTTQIRCAVGEQYGTLTVSKLIKGGKNPKAEFICDCGLLSIAIRGEVVNGRWICKCQRVATVWKPRPPSTGRPKTHGKSHSPVWRVWRSMKSRCENPNHPDFHLYGSRGICVEWSSFEEFYADLGDPPPKMQIERLDNDGNYSRANCEWASIADQSVNKRTSMRWMVHGIEYKSAALAGNAIGLPANTVRKFTHNGREGFSCRKTYEIHQSRMTADCTQPPPLIKKNTIGELS